MANPQVENGHLKIANEVFDALMRFDFSGNEYAVIMAVIRLSWGWHKKDCEVSIYEICRMTRRARSSVTDTMKRMREQNILRNSPGGGRGNISKWAFNKDWESWKTVRPTGQFKTVRPTGQNEINSPPHRTDSVRPTGQFITAHRTVSPCNSLSPKEQLAPKAILKDNKDKTASQSTEKDTAKTAHPPDPAYEEFVAEFKTKRTIPYRNKTADFVHLAALRRALAIGTKETPMKWRKAIGNYFTSTLSAYTLADLCQRYDCFINGRMDRFGKPAPAEEQTLYDYDESRPK